MIQYARWHNVSLETKVQHNMKKNILAGTAAVIITFGAAGCASEQSEQAQMQSQAKISKEQAQQTALAKAPGGTIKEGELENET